MSTDADDDAPPWFLPPGEVQARPLIERGLTPADVRERPLGAATISFPPGGGIFIQPGADPVAVADGIPVRLTPESLRALGRLVADAPLTPPDDAGASRDLCEGSDHAGSYSNRPTFGAGIPFAGIRVAAALNIARQHGATAGPPSSAHRAWVIDQMVRALLGDDAAYRDWVRTTRLGRPTEEPREWSEGAPDMPATARRQDDGTEP